MTEIIKNKGGRPRLPAHLKSNKRIHISLTKNEIETVNLKAKHLNLPRTLYIKKAILNSKIEVKPFEFFEEIKYFNRTFANINKLILGLQSHNIDANFANEELKKLVDFYKNQISIYREQTK